MEKQGNLMQFRPDIKVLDATIRDGGLVNNFFFDDEFVKNLYATNVKAGIDYMEFGYKASKEIFNPDEFGKWKFCDEESIRSIVGDNDTDLKIAVMADVGRCDFKKDILPKSESVIDMIRVATYINTMPAAIEIIEHCHALGYETTCNIMAVSTAKESDIYLALELLGESNVDVIYLVDSYGSLYPEQIRDLAFKYQKIASKYGKKIGIHAHNNQQLAFANTIEACTYGVSYLDSTMGGMGRGAGNCSTEMLMGFLKNPKYQIVPVLKFVQNDIEKLKAQGVVWGYDIPYLCTGILNVHPRSAIAAIKENDKDYSNFYIGLWDREY
jgi:4-hydroxy 2-oxovalerate aldolase